MPRLFLRRGSRPAARLRRSSNAPDPTMSLDLAAKTYIEARLANEGPQITLAYVFWLFLGLFSAHRFYLGKTGTAVLQIISYFFVIGVIWFIIDAFLLPDLVRARQDEVRRRIAGDLAA